MAQNTIEKLHYSLPSLAAEGPTQEKSNTKTGWLFFGLMHIMCLAVFFVGWSWIAIGVAIALYFIRMFAITAFYHRYFSHRAFKTSRVAQFIFAWMGASAAQQGPLWWAANHRHHHKFSDQPEDIHSPVQKGFWYSHIAWIPANQSVKVDYAKIPDLTKYPELRWMDDNYLIPPIVLGAFTFVLGAGLNYFWPALSTDGMQMLLWGFFVSTVLLYHGTFFINSLAHVWGTRRYQTKDDSRNNFWLALLTLGEGWHNNHHYYATSVRQGFYWWEVDISYYLLWLMSKLGIVWDLKYIPSHLREKRIQSN